MLSGDLRAARNPPAVLVLAPPALGAPAAAAPRRVTRFSLPPPPLLSPGESAIVPDLAIVIWRDSDFLARVAKLSPEEETLLFSAALRREELGIEARLTLFAHLAQRLQNDLGFQKPEHFSDEKLVLFVTAAVTARRSSPLKNTSQR